MNLPGLELRDVVKHFGSHRAVDGASLCAASGEIIALLGPSGCGKTTTLRLIAGFERLESGHIEVAGADIVGLPPFRRDIGLVFQDYALFPHMSVARNVEYGMRQRRLPQAERDRRRAEVLRLVRLEGMEDKRPAALSGGEQQRVALARALAIAPKLLLLDEPLSNLDAKLREALRVELREILRSVETTTLLVTHDQAEAIGIADRVAVMNRGRIVQIGTAREVYEEPNSRFVAEFIGQSLWFDGRFAATGNACGRFLSDDGIVFAAERPMTTAMRYGLCIRPEHIHLRARAGDSNRIAATVERVEFLGADLIVRCRLTANGRTIAIPVRSDEPELAGPGDHVELGVAPVRCRVVADT